MVADLTALLSRHATGQDTTQEFAEFMRTHGDLFPSNPRSVEELLDDLAQQAAAGDRLMRSLSPEQRAELGAMIGQSLGPMAQQLAQLSEQLRALRPQMFRPHPGRARPTGTEPGSYGDAVSALDDLADLDALLEQLDQQYSGAGLDDIDLDAVHRQLGAGAVDDLQKMRQLDTELRRQGWIQGSQQDPMLSPKALRQLGTTALAAVFQQLKSGKLGGHELPRLGSAPELTGSSRAWEFGDEQPLDVIRTLGNAVRRGGGPSLHLQVEDFEVVETERHSRASVALCVDLSYSMISQGRWAPMKRTALALAHLMATKFPQDSLQIIGFGRRAQPLSVGELATIAPDGVQGTNLQHALRLAGQHLRRHSDGDPVVLIITDGEPTAHLEPDGTAAFAWPPIPQTIRLTVREVDLLTRYGASINTFMLGADPGLRRFVDAMAKRCGGRVLTPDPNELGSYLIADYLRARSRK
jgi:uncharacterized protein with von Willebrand factor type A (vWA) domain